MCVVTVCKKSNIPNKQSAMARYSKLNHHRTKNNNEKRNHEQQQHEQRIEIKRKRPICMRNSQRRYIYMEYLFLFLRIFSVVLQHNLILLSPSLNFFSVHSFLQPSRSLAISLTKRKYRDTYTYS